jgi:hypothetical protein
MIDPFSLAGVADSILRASTADNDINTIMRGLQNAYPQPKKFPRSEGDMDAIMIRRVHARQQLAQERIVRHRWRVAAVAGAVIFAPLAVAAVLRMWGFALAWIAS